jgi:hemoglobin
MMSTGPEIFNNNAREELKSREDIIAVLEAFYKQVVHDDLVGHFFTEVVQLDMEKHIPVITDFWEAILFDSRSYKKNVMEVHQHIHLLSKIKKEHLARWIEVFSKTVDALFAGSKATLMKQRAQSIATLMDIKLNPGGIGKL